MDQDQFVALLKEREGVRPQAYDDRTGNPITPGMNVLGHPTVGVGFNLDRDDAQQQIEALGLNYADVCAGTQTLNDDQINTLLNITVNEAIDGARANVSNFDTLPDDKQSALVDMVFNLGEPNFAKFEDVIDAVEAEDWPAAASAMEDSKWYREGGDRADAVVDAMRGDDEDGTQFGPSPRPEQDPAPDSTLDPDPEPTPNSTPNSANNSAATADSTPNSVPDPVPDPAPDPSPDSTPSPTPDPLPDPLTDPIPDSATNPSEPDPAPDVPDSGGGSGDGGSGDVGGGDAPGGDAGGSDQ